MTLTRRGITVVTVMIVLAMVFGIGIGMSLTNIVCYEDEILVWNNDSHSKCVHIDDFQSWMDEQNAN